MAKIIYIGGYGRSGSTILEIILSNHSDVVGIGEISFFQDSCLKHDRLCACGLSYEDCEFWSPFIVRDPPSAELAALLHRIESLYFIPKLLRNKVSDRDRQAYRDYHARLFEFVAQQARKRVLVDSSKSSWMTAGRFLALQRLCNQDVYVIHLVRNGLSVMKSLAVTGSNRALEGYIEPPALPGFRAACGWVTSNLWTALLGRLLGSKHYILLRYEELLSDPVNVVNQIGRFCDLDFSELNKQLNEDNEFQVGHMVGGNRIRKEGKVRLQRSVKACDDHELKLSHRLIFALTGGGLMNKWYGYDQKPT